MNKNGYRKGSRFFVDDFWFKRRSTTSHGLVNAKLFKLATFPLGEVPISR
ncbi:MAG: hypothetical protein KA498_13510 [Neisseriaceae bacterium]|nr:hypothetical protein [Neisseriaceae bacterium]